MESEPFEPLAPCNEGGSRLHTGFDVNGNGMLDLGERMDTVVLCHGMRGLPGPQGQPGTGGLDAVPQRLETTTIPVGNLTCPEGGVMILSGLDVNFNEQLEHEETATQNMLCNGRIGDNGLNGSDGTDGATENSPTIGLSFIADGHKMGSVDAIRTGHSYDVVG